MVANVDTPALIAAAAAAASLLVAFFAAVYSRRLSRAVDEALDRIAGLPPPLWWKRATVLRRETRMLQERAADSQLEEARLSGAIAEAPIGILLTDDDGVVLMANEAASQYLGARHGEAVAEARIREAIESVIRERQAVNRTVEIYTPQRRHLDIDALPLEHRSESAGAAAFVRDVTDQYRVDTMRSDFIANVGHELKTPLGALAVLAETLAHHIDDPAVATRMAERLVSEAGRLSNLIGDILDLSEAEAAGRDRSPVDLGSVIEEVVDGLAAGIEDRGIDFCLEPFLKPAVVWGERRQLRTLFDNLIDNAVKYSRAGGAERRPRVSVDARMSKREVVVSIEDEGIGISERHLGRIFERFYRVDQARSRDTGGTGLGLSIARHIARSHGGEITVESQVGVGSTFRVHLPLWGEP